MLYLTMSGSKVIKGNQNIEIGDLIAYDGKTPLFYLKYMQDLPLTLLKGTYSISIISTNKNTQLARFSSKFADSTNARAISINGANRIFKVGNTCDECLGDIILGISENGLGRLMKSITANVELFDFVLKYGSKNIKLIVK